MKIESGTSDETAAAELGRRITAIRLSKNLTQRQLADQAGLGLRTIQRLEQGSVATRLTGFISVCRVLGLMERIEQLLPEPPPIPADQPAGPKQPRRRASAPRKPIAAQSPWTWRNAEGIMT